MITFSKPLFLLLLPLLYWIFKWYRHSLSDIPFFRRVISLILRVTLFLLLIFSLAGIQWVKSSQKLAVIFLVDVSDSIRHQSEPFAQSFIQLVAAEKPADDILGIILFGKNALVEQTPVATPVLGTFTSTPIRTASNLAEAVRLGMGLFPPDAQKRIVIISDGNQTEGDLLQEASLAGTNGIEISVIPLQMEVTQEVLVEDVITPQTINPGEPFEVATILRSSGKAKGTLWLYRNGSPVREPVMVKLDPGKEVYRFREVLDETGLFTYDVRLETDSDQIVENNRAGSFTRVVGRSKVLLINPSEPLQQALLPLTTSLDIDVGSAGQLPGSLIALQNYDAILINNVSALQFSDDQMRAVESYVRDFGGGFIMVGGENSFGVGGYYQTPVERALPVNMDLKSKTYFPSLGIVFVIDKSGSMADLSGGVEKIEIAKEATIASISLLSDTDRVGVIGFDGAAKWIVKMRATNERKRIISEVATLRPGGGTNLEPALAEAINALKTLETQLKHIIILSDGRTAPGNFDSLVQKATGANITISTVAIGGDADDLLMQQLAQRGGGRYYASKNARRVPQIFTKETLLASRSYLIEEEFVPRQVQPHPMLKGIPPLVPPLLGYVGTSPKSTAETIWVTHHDAPLLAAWQFGLGRSVAFTSDADTRWAVNWLNWAYFQPFWQQVLRWTMRKVSTQPFDVRLEAIQQKGHVVIDAIDAAGNFRNFLELEGVLVNPKLENKPLRIRQTAPGRYESEFAINEPGIYLVHIFAKDQTGFETAGLKIPYSSEFQSFESDPNLLQHAAQQTGGTLIRSPEEVYQHNLETVTLPVDIWEYLVQIAIVLFFLDVLIRRLMIEWHQFDPLVAKLAGMRSYLTPKPRPENRPSRSAGMSQLIHRKQELKHHKTPAISTSEEPDLSSHSTETTGTVFMPDIPDIEAPAPPQRDVTEHEPPDETESYTSRLLKAKQRAKHQ
ncbi:MAG: VWA domain-containing protein [Gemmatimonadetes bacterium]|nr:MAG: VWA domain-containing protein [Gemmatimonadota bacterium]